MRILVIPAELIYPTDRLAGATLARLEDGLRYWYLERYDFVAVTGGLYLPTDVQTKSAAELMAEWLVDHGVPRERIIIEACSLDTFQNVEFTLKSARAIQPDACQEWTVVSHLTHLRRFALTCRAWGITMHRAAVRYPLPIMARLGEIVAYLMHRWDPKGTGALARHNRTPRCNRTWRPAALAGTR